MPLPSQPVGSLAEKDYLGLHLKELPYFRALVRAVEARFYRNFALQSPTLDIGCGDGHFATVAFDRKIEVGIDPWETPLREAAQRGAYKLLLQADGAFIPFTDSYFASAFSNSVLEHIPHVEDVLNELGRVLKPGSLFLFCVPNHQFLEGLSFADFLDRLGLHALSRLYQRFFNRISRHVHCDPPQVWEKRLEQAGFELLDWWHYFPPSAMHVVEWGHYFGLPALMIKWLTGRWLLVADDWNIAWLKRWLSKFYLMNPKSDQGVYTFYVTKKV